MAAGHERLLVGRRDDLAGPQRREDRAEADDPAGADDDEVDVVPDRQPLEGVGTGLDRGARGQVEAAGSARVAGQGDGERSELARLGLEQLGLVAGRQGDDADRRAEPDEDVDRLAPDRAARAEEGDPDRRRRDRAHVRKVST